MTFLSPNQDLDWKVGQRERGIGLETEDVKRIVDFRKSLEVISFPSSNYEFVVSILEFVVAPSVAVLALDGLGGSCGLSV